MARDDDRLVDLLRQAVGPAHVVTDPQVAAGHVRDWTGRFVGATPAVVRPGSTAEVADVVRICRGTGTALVPQGGNTGLVGGGVPLRGEVVLATGRLAGPPEVDQLAGQATVGAGVPVAELQRAAAAAGLAYGVDLASRDSATVGGTIATNAGGLRVLRHGDTRAQLVGVEAVLGDGSVVSHLGGLTRDNTGYHLPSLLAGSEGTLAVLTRARVRLVPPAHRTAVALLGLASVAEAAEAAQLARARVPGVQAVELMLADGVELVLATLGTAPPLPDRHAAYLLVEAGGDDPLQPLAEAAAGLPGVRDAALADDARGRAALWAVRENHTGAINTLGPPVKLDVTLPAAELAAFCVWVPETVRSVCASGRTWLFGHAADGNVHVNVTAPLDAAHRLEDAVLRLVAALGGSISSEHGIGSAKREWIGLARSAAELDAFRRLKAALDPDGILNPNALLPPG